MPWKRHVLVVANVTAGSEELLNVLRKRAEQGPTTVRMIVPATPFAGGRAAAMATLEAALAKLRDAGLDADGAVGPSDPLTAAIEAWDPKRYDEIVVSTLPMRLSKWLRAGLPARIERLTEAPVTHVVSQPPGHVLRTEPAPAREDRGVLMGPLSVLGWGAAPTKRSRIARRAERAAEHSETSS